MNANHREVVPASRPDNEEIAPASREHNGDTAPASREDNGDIVPASRGDKGETAPASRAGNGDTAPASQGDDLLPVQPSALVRTVMRPMTRLLNPVFVRLAGKRHFPVAAQLHHVGRRSGRRYVTPVGARLSGDVIVIPLTFGNQSDWSKNVRAAGRCTIRLNGVDYSAAGPQFLGVDSGRPDALRAIRSAYNPVMRASFRMLGIKQFMCLQVVDYG